MKIQDFEGFIKKLLDDHDLEFHISQYQSDREIWIDFGIIEKATYDESASEEQACLEIEKYFSNIEQKISDNNPDPGFEFDIQVEEGPTIYAIIPFTFNKDQDEIDFPTEQLNKFIANTKDTLKSLGD
ncbi:MAG: hypothetical protein HN605_00625 [Thaumarchaeota archaeon]|jgi:hypothetical protein|nr:hypothetical protein [Nitrososphaerota archaeon]